MCIMARKSTKLFSKSWLNYFSNIFWENGKKRPIWPFLTKNSINLVSMQSLIIVEKCAIAQNNCNIILMKRMKTIFKIVHHKNPKNQLFCQIEINGPSSSEYLHVITLIDKCTHFYLRRTEEYFLATNSFLHNFCRLAHQFSFDSGRSKRSKDLFK